MSHYTLKNIDVITKDVNEYIDIVGLDKINKLKEIAKPLIGKKVLNINATGYGGGVAELLRTQVGIMRSLGIKADWKVMVAETEFYDVTKLFHNTMQGDLTEVTEHQKDIYINTIINNADAFDEEYDFIIVHDPQPLAMLRYIKNPKGKWIWRCHIDTSTPNMKTWDFLYPYTKDYDAVIFTLKEFANKNYEFNNLTIIPPSIDPLSPKNFMVCKDGINDVFKKYEIDPSRPLITQVSRFDVWKDPLGIIDVYRNLKSEFKDLQLALIGSMASDDPEGISIYDKTLRKAGEDKDIKIYTNFHNVGDYEVNIFQQASDVILQKSLKEGFGLTVAEALWKETPVIGGNVGGIKLQINDGETGYLVNSVEEATEKTRYLLNNPVIAREMGLKGKEVVREKFLSTREIEDHLVLLNKLL